MDDILPGVIAPVVASGETIEKLRADQSQLIEAKPIDIEDECDQDSSDDDVTLSEIRPNQVVDRQKTLEQSYIDLVCCASSGHMAGDETLLDHQAGHHNKLSFIYENEDIDDNGRTRTREPDLTDVHHRIHEQYSNLGDFATLAQRRNLNISIANGKVNKKVISPGGTECISDTSAVIYDCACWCQGEREPYDSSWYRRKAFLTDLSSDLIIDGIRHLLLTMRQGEFCEGLIQSECAFGKLGVMPRIPPDAKIFCIISVIRVYCHGFQVRQLLNFNQSTDDENFFACYKICDQARIEGNWYISHHQYMKALRRYKSAMSLLENLTYKDGEQQVNAQRLLRKLYTNSANALVSLKKPRTALTFCKLALDLDRKCTKTHWLYAKAWDLRNDHDRAISYLNRALNMIGASAEMEKTRKQFVKFRQDLEKKKRLEESRSKDLAKLMARGLGLQQ